MNEGTGLTLVQAVEQYTDREKWRAWQELCRPPERETRFNYLFAYEGWETARADDACRERRARRHAKLQAWHALAGNLMARLRSGEFIATGMYCPMRPDSAPCIIAPNLFPYLQPDFAASAFSGDGIKFIHVRIHPANANAGVKDAGGGSVPADHAKLRRPPGRPGIQPEYMEEVVRRAEAGLLSGNLAQDVRDLQAWGKERGLLDTHQQEWDVRSLENHIRRTYNRLIARKTGIK